MQYDPSRPYQFLTTGKVVPRDQADEEFKKVRKAWANRSETDRLAGNNHALLKAFYEDDARYSSQFQQFYEVLKKYDRSHNPALAAKAFQAFRKYHHSAFETDSFFGGTRKRDYSSLRGWLRERNWFNRTFGSEAGKAEADRLIEELVETVQGMEELPLDVMAYPNSLGPDSAGFDAIKNGDEPLLVAYEGWYEESTRFYRERQLQVSYEEGDPSLKTAAPELFPPVGVVDGRLGDKDGDPIRWHKGLDARLVNDQGEEIPLIVEEDNTVRVPNPDEINGMRESGEVRPFSLEPEPRKE